MRNQQSLCMLTQDMKALMMWCGEEYLLETTFYSDSKIQFKLLVSRVNQTGHIFLLLNSKAITMLIGK